MMADTQWRDQVDAWDKAYRRKRKIIVLLILALIVVGVAGFLLYPTARDFYSRIQYYNQAKALLQEGQTDAAAEAFWKAGNYLDAQEYAGQLNYEKAQEYLEAGRITYAAISFGKAGDYLDAREQSFALWERFADRTVRCASDWDVVGWIRPDGTGDFNHNQVDSFVGDYNYPGDFSSWTDLVSISVNRGNTVGTFADGTVRYLTNEKNIEDYGPIKAYDPKWTDIILAYYDWSHVIALKSDGTVCAECFSHGSRCDLLKEAAQWTDIIALCNTRPLIGLKADGTLVTASCQEFADWDVTPEYRAMVRDLEAMTNVVAVRTQGIDYWARNVMLLADGTTRALGIDLTQYEITPFDELFKIPESEAWFPANMEAMEEPPRDRAAIAASFPAAPAVDDAQYYQQAVSLQEQGDLAQAAIAFGKAGDYEDAAIRSMTLWQQIGKLPTVAVRYGVAAALKEDGTVALADPEKQLGKKPANLNKQFVALYFCNADLFGITPEGNVLAIGKQTETLPATEHVVRILYTQDYGVVIQKTDGSLISERGTLPAWNNVVLLLSNGLRISVLSADGIARGGYEPKTDTDSGEYIPNVPDQILTDIAGEFYGLTPEGTVLGGAFDSSGSPIPLWENVKYIYYGDEYLYGLLNNGHVMVESELKDEWRAESPYGREAGKWTDIVALSVCDDCVIGLKKDGTLEFAGIKELSKLQKEVEKLQGLMVP